MRLSLILLPLLVMAPAFAGEKASTLPHPLHKLGFGDARTPVRVTFLGPIGEAADHPTLRGGTTVAPANTTWVFADPRPVWQALAAARTSSFAQGRFPGAKARIRIDASTDTLRRVIHLHYRPGHGDLSVRRKRADERPRGGGWTFAPAADRALIALLSRTEPYAVGVPIARLWQLTRAEARPGGIPHMGMLTDPDSFGAWRSELLFRSPQGASWKLPQGFTWKTHRLITAELPSTFRGKRLDWSGMQMRRGVLSWKLRTVVDKSVRGQAPKTGSILLAAIRAPEDVRHVRADMADGTQVEIRPYASDDWHTPRRSGIWLRVRERGYDAGAKTAKGAKSPWVTFDTIELHWDGRYTRSFPDGRRQHGRIPPKLQWALEKGFGVRQAARPAPVTHDHYVDDSKTIKPGGLIELLAYVAGAHD